MLFMSTRTPDYLEAIEHLPQGSTLIFYQVEWDDYERLVEDLAAASRPNLRVSYDCGRLEIMSPLNEHGGYASFIDRLTQIMAEELNLDVQSYGATTWKLRALQKGAEPDCCYYVKNAARVIGKGRFNLDSAPPPDVVVEIDITRESFSKFPIYAAFGVPEIWQYDGDTARMYKLSGDDYREIEKSKFFPPLTPKVLAAALAESKTAGQTAALRSFRKQIKQS